MRLKVQAGQCTTCRLCTFACAFKHSGKLDLNKSAIRITPQFPDSLAVKVNFCSQCAQGYCIAACQQGALQREADGRVILVTDKCDTCKGEYKCVKACKLGGMFKPYDNIPPLKCDLCGGDPECVKVCSQQLISYG